MRFGQRCAEAIAERGRLCVGIDPHSALLEAWGLPANETGLERFADTCIESFGHEAAVVKPQSAFFEVYGSRGIAVLERIVAACKQAGALVVVDAKRGDIGSTMTAYAEAYLSDSSALAGDAVTLSPYLGFGSLQPALELAGQTGRGVFVLARTSNPEGAHVQYATAGECSVAQAIADAAGAHNAQARPYGDVGLVVGARPPHTADQPALDLTRLNGLVLAPGFGAQGATSEHLRGMFGADLHGVLPASAREILAHGPDVRALRDQFRRVRDSLGS